MNDEKTVATKPYIDPDGNACSQSSTTAVDHGYDAENHTVGTSSLPFTTKPIGDCGSTPTITYGAEDQAVYGWGPAGHPLTLAWSFPNETNAASGTEGLHWDGGSLLYTSNANGLGRVFLQGDGYEQQGVFIATPRDASARVVGQSFADSPFDSNPNEISPFSQVTSDFYIDMPRGDGINTGLDTIQGVRAYNKDSTSWTTPDAYAGEPHDPMSAQKYVWNGNNPMSYSDPTGYDEIDINFYWSGMDVSTTQGDYTTNQVEHTFITVKDNNGKIIKTYQFGPGPFPWGPLLEKDYKLTSTATLVAETSSTQSQWLLRCADKCDPEEDRLQAFYNAFPTDTFLYGWSMNSNTATSDMLAYAGLRYPVAPFETVGPASGWDPSGRRILDAEFDSGDLWW